MSAGIVSEAMRLVHRMGLVERIDFRAALIEQGIFNDDERLVIEDPIVCFFDVDISPQSPRLTEKDDQT